MSWRSTGLCPCKMKNGSTEQQMSLHILILSWGSRVQCETSPEGFCGCCERVPGVPCVPLDAQASVLERMGKKC